jgi:CubicO group peptidase (beta-lactamase class C family)
MITMTRVPPTPAPLASDMKSGDSCAADPKLAGQDQEEAQINGACDDRFARGRDVFAEYLTSGLDIGASIAVRPDGEVTVDLWGGYFDETYTRTWPRYELVNGFSSTKTMTALCALVSADRGELDLDAPVAEYWPEFAAADKAGVLVRHLLGHTSGLAAGPSI